MFAEVKTVIAHVNDQCVLVQTAGAEVVHQAADIFVQAMNRLGIAVVEVVKVGDRVFVEGAGLHVVDAVDAVSSLADPVRLGSVVAFGVGERLGIIDLLVVVSAVMSLGRLERVVHGLVREVEEERTVAIASFSEPVDCQAREHVGVVSLELPRLPVDVQQRVDVDALPAGDFALRCHDRGVHMLPNGETGMRAVFHRDVSDDDVTDALATLASVLSESWVES